MRAPELYVIASITNSMEQNTIMNIGGP